MELKQLRYFLAVADTLNFSRAAETLYISQPALSYQIAELEKELGVELFVRDRRRVSLTAEGQALLEPARATLRQADRLPMLAKQGLLRPEGTLRIGFDNTEDHFEHIGVTRTVADFSRSWPGVELELARLPFTECADRVLYDDLDLAFLVLRHRENLPPDLTGRPVYRSRIVLFFSQESPAATCEEALRSHELILVGEKPRGNSRILRVLEDMKVDPVIRQADSMTSAFVYAQSGRGILLLPEVYCKVHPLPGLRFLPIDSEAAELTHAVVWNRGNANPNVRRFLETLPEIE